MANCEVCNDLKQKRSGVRLAIEFTSSELEHSALVQKCQFCSIMRQGILLMQDDLVICDRCLYCQWLCLLRRHILLRDLLPQGKA
ncbi:hypothetical protein V8C34DRAFT_282694, partial [Trichoderma compactum]